ncbi:MULTISPECIES: FecCD family ABC transporter permease [unclassified Clostridium]|uniref:FecCD family ABC transporter permease n=1 Tax=unclassified Clostridium TaxID=2614128 RepID=UPI0025B9C3C4|nr:MULTISPECIES: iron ABC transporter permease [unclassified Clostridium]
MKKLYEQKRKKQIKWPIMIAMLMITFFVSLFMGRYIVSPKVVLEILYSHIFKINLNMYEVERSVVLGIRLPRTILSLLIGAGLAISGTTFQGLFRNPLVSPDVLGVSSGAGFGVALGILIFSNSTFTSLSAFIFGIVSVVLTFLLAKNKNKVSVLSLVLSGIVVSSIFSSLISLVKYVADPYDKLPAITYWLMGSFAKTSFKDIKLVIVPIMLGIIIILLLRWRINILSLGDEEANSLGVNPVKIRLIAIICATIITASSVTVVGVIGWVGLVIPHVARRIVGVDHKNLLPASGIIGAIFLTIVDIVARTATSVEIPIGILTALIGAPFFGYLLKRNRKVIGD